MALSFEQLKDAADLVRDEILAKANTALRVGTLSRDTIEKIEEILSSVNAVIEGLHESVEDLALEIERIKQLLNQIPAGLAASIDALKAQIALLFALLNDKADKSDLLNLSVGLIYRGKVNTIAELPSDPLTVRTGHAFIVLNETEPETGRPYIFQAEVEGQPPTVTWTNTFLTVFPGASSEEEKQRNPVNEIRFAAPMAGNIYGDKYLACNGANVAQDDYPLLLLPPGLIAFKKARNDYTGYFNSVAYGNGLYVFVGNFNYFYVSENLLSFTLVRPQNLYNKVQAFIRVKYINNVFYALSDDTSIQRSSDGYTWTQEMPPFDGFVNGSRYGVRDITFGNGVWVLVGDFSNLLSRADSESSWTKRPNSLNINGKFSSVAFGNGVFVATWAPYTSNSTMLTSENGTSWTDRGRAGLPLFGRLIFYNGKFLLDTTGGLASSEDGINWTIDNPQSKLFLASNGNIHISTETKQGNNGTTTYWITASEDEEYASWEYVYKLALYLISEVIWNGTRFVAVGIYEGPFISTDAIQLPDMQNAWIKALE